MKLNFKETLELLSIIDCDSSIEERCESFKENYLNVIYMTDDFMIENPLHSIAYVSNIVSSVCDEEDYEYCDEGFLLETCQSIVLSDKLDDLLMEFNISGFKEEIKNFLLKNEKYELLNTIKDA